MHVQSCCFACLNLLIFCRSRLAPSSSLRKLSINYLTNRGHDKAFLTTQIQSAPDVPRANAIKDKPTRTETTPFVRTCNLTLPNVAYIIHKHSHFLYSSERCRNVLKNHPTVAYRRSNVLTISAVVTSKPQFRTL